MFKKIIFCLATMGIAGQALSFSFTGGGSKKIKVIRIDLGARGPITAGFQDLLTVTNQVPVLAYVTEFTVFLTREGGWSDKEGCPKAAAGNTMTELEFPVRSVYYSGKWEKADYIYKMFKEAMHIGTYIDALYFGEGMNADSTQTTGNCVLKPDSVDSKNPITGIRLTPPS